MASEPTSPVRPDWFLWAEFSATMVGVSGVIITLSLADLAVRNGKAFNLDIWVPLQIGVAYPAAVLIAFVWYRLRNRTNRHSHSKRTT